jgi:hypothetical protein
MSTNTQFTFSLAELRKHIDRLGDFVRSSNWSKLVSTPKNAVKYSFESVATPVNVTLDTSTLFRFVREKSRLNETFTSRQALVNNELTTYLTLSRELACLKDTLYSENSKKGVDKLLTDITQLETEKKIYEQILKSVTSSCVMSSELLNSLFDEELRNRERMENCIKEGLTYNTPNTNTQVALFNQTDLETRIKNLRVQINNLEAKRNEINWSNKVTVTLNPATVEALGI